jgi:hypothetical protein
LGSSRKAISVGLSAVLLASLVATVVAPAAFAGNLTGVTSSLAGDVVGTTVSAPQVIGSAITATDVSASTQPNAFAIAFPTGTILTGVSDWKVTLAGGASGCPTGTFDFANLGNNFVYDPAGDAVEFWTTNSCADQTVTLAIGAGSMVLPPADGAMSVTTYAGPMPGIDTTNFVMTWSTGTVVDTGSADMGLVGPAAQLAFTTAYPSSPTTTDLGTIAVAIKDASGNTITSDSTSTVTLATNQNTGSFACSGAGGLTQTAVNGVATFTGCTQSTIANGYTLTASATSLPDVTGSSFDITSGPATQIRLWWSCPSTGCVSPVPEAGAGLPFIEQPAVEIEDAQGRTVTSDSSTQVTLSLTAGPSATLSCTGGLTMTVTAGWAWYSGCSIDTAGTGYELTATTASLGSSSRGPFDVTGPNTAARLTFLASPPATTYAYLGTIKVAVEDLFGNVITGDTRTVDLQLWQIVGNNVQQVTLACANGTSQAAQGGVAIFVDCMAPSLGQYYLEAVATVGGFYTPSADFTVIAPPPPLPAPAPTPQIALVVSASPTSLTGSGRVTYTYTVTNPGSLTLSGVSVSDTACTPAYVAGDTNKDTLLEPGESWTYTCTATLSATTTDAAKALGANNGTTVSASAATTVTVTVSALTPVALTDGIAAGVDRGTSGFGTTSLVVLPNHYVTVLGRTSPNLAGSIVEIWVRSKTGDWHRLTSRLVATDGTVHYFARVNGWTAYWLKFAGDSTHAPAASHGRIATSKS